MTVNEDAITACKAALRSLLSASGARSAAVFDRGGRCISDQGLAREIDVAAVGFLATAAYSATEEIAKLIGDRGFGLVLHQGEREHLLVTCVEPDHLLVVLFDDRTVAGLVAAFAKAAARRIGWFLTGGAGAPASVHGAA